MIMVKEVAMSVSAVSGVSSSSTTSIEAQIAQLRRQERQLTRQLTELVSEGEVDEAAQVKQQLLQAQITTIEMRIAQLQARRSEAAQAAVSKALPALSGQGTGAVPATSRVPGTSSSANRLDVEL
jgi:chromosome segregation ATPase